MSKTRDTRKGRGGDSRERIIQTAARLFRAQGFHATGLNQIVEESQAPKGSLYHYFPEGKEELAVEAMQVAGELLIERLNRLMKESPNRALDELVEMTIHDLEATDYREGCPIATVALETAANSHPLRKACNSIFDRSLAIVRESLVGSGVDPDKAEIMAMTAFAAYEGALLLSKVRKSPEPLRTVVKQIKFYLKSCMA